MYEDYMQNLIGFPRGVYPNTYEERDFNPYGVYYESNYRGKQWQNNLSDDELEECYPEIYNIVYPMVQKACRANTSPINQTVIDNMVNEILTNIEANQTIQLNINLGNEVLGENRGSINKNEKKDSRENRSCENCDRQIGRNSLLRDLIRILLLRELGGRPGYRPGFGPRPRPPYPPYNRPPRPPMPRYDGSY